MQGLEIIELDNVIEAAAEVDDLLHEALAKASGELAVILRRALELQRGDVLNDLEQYASQSKP